MEEQGITYVINGNIVPPQGGGSIPSAEPKPKGILERVFGTLIAIWGAIHTFFGIILAVGWCFFWTSKNELQAVELQAASDGTFEEISSSDISLVLHFLGVMSAAGIILGVGALIGGILLYKSGKRKADKNV